LQTINFVSCIENHRVGWLFQGEKLITASSSVEIKDTDNLTIQWNAAAWKNNFAAVLTKPAKPKVDYTALMDAPKDYTCPLCNVTAHTKRQMINHLNTRKHKEEERLANPHKQARKR
jgi:hypothetical protein